MRNRTRSRNTYCTTHRRPKAPTVVISIRMVPPSDFPLWCTWPTSLTAIAETPRNAKDVPTNTSPCFHRPALSICRHTHRRLSSNEMTLPTATATKLAITALSPVRRTARSPKLTSVVTKEAALYRTSFGRPRRAPTIPLSLMGTHRRCPSTGTDGNSTGCCIPRVRGPVRRTSVPVQQATGVSE